MDPKKTETLHNQGTLLLLTDGMADWS